MVQVKFGTHIMEGFFNLKDCMEKNDKRSISEFVYCDVAKDNYVERAKNSISIWIEETSECAIMIVVSSFLNDSYRINVIHKDNFNCERTYGMTAYCDDDENLCYKDCSCIVRIFDDKNGFTSKIEYKNGSGLIRYLSNKSALCWENYAENGGSILVFVRCK